MLFCKIKDVVNDLDDFDKIVGVIVYEICDDKVIGGCNFEFFYVSLYEFEDGDFRFFCFGSSCVFDFDRFGRL